MHRDLQIEGGLTQWAMTALWVAALATVGRGFTAKRRLQGDLGERRMKALAVLEPTHLIPVLTDIVLFAHRHVDWGIARHLLGQPEDRLPVALSDNDLATSRRALRDVCADAANLHILQDTLFSHARRQAIWASPFLLSWAYLIFWSAERGVDLPVPASLAAFGISCTCFGFVVSERLAEARAGEEFAELQRRYEGKSA